MPAQYPPSRPECSEHRMSDRDLQQAIIERLGTCARRLKIRVEQGNVYLTGQVSTALEAQYIPRGIQQMAGVGMVRANFQVRATEHRPNTTTVLDWRRIPWRPTVSVAVGLMLSLLAWNSWANSHGSSFALQQANVIVTLADQPASGAFLTLHPLQILRDSSGKDLSGLRPRGVVSADGRVEWTTWSRGDGVPPGQYIVTAIWHQTAHGEADYPSESNALAPHLGDPRLSPLRLIVGEETDADQSHELRIDSPHARSNSERRIRMH